jgi:uncharacterized protein YegP (UPF0339 family)
MGQFEIKQAKNDQFHFNLKSGNGQIILTSEMYTTKAACQNGIESVKKNSTEDKLYDRKEGKNGKYHFNLKAANHQVIGSSQMYADKGGMENGIASVMKNAAEAEIEELA